MMLLLLLELGYSRYWYSKMNRSRKHILEAMVAALPDFELLEERVLGLRCLKVNDGLVGSDKVNGSGDERADW